MAIALVMGMAAGCGRVERAEPGGDIRPGDIVEIQEGTQAESGDLRIGLGYVRRTPPVEVLGASRRLEAGLWIYVREDSSRNLTVSARAGQRVPVGSSAIFVEEVRAGPRAAVRLAIPGARSQPGPSKP